MIGIDLGTTNSLAAVWRDGAPVLVPNAHGAYLTPSAVSLGDDGEIVVGQAARERVTSHPQLSAHAFKRYMGTNRRLRLGTREFGPEQLSAFVLRSLKADAEAYLGTSVDSAVITVPAYFNDRQRKATRLAAEMAGLDVARLINEPTAAALAYGIAHGARDAKFLVFDLGGGTFDVSVLELFDGVIEVRAVAGDNFLGGEDFVDVAAAWFQQVTRTSLSRDGADAAAFAQLRRQSECALWQLSKEDEAEIRIDWRGRTVAATLTRALLAQQAEPLLERLRRPLERAIQDSRISPTQLSHVVLAGGATRMPMVRRVCALMLGRPAMHQIDPDEVVARGAAVQVGLLERDASLREVVLTDVAPYTLGIEVVRSYGARHYVGGQFLPIIERNTIVPASRVERVHTLNDNQADLRIRIYQGESRRVADNIELGELVIDVPPGPAGAQAADVRFTYDVSGLLEVDVCIVGSGEKRQLVIQEHAATMTPAEVDQRLAQLAGLKIAPREQSENSTLKARAERLHEQLLGDARQEIAAAIVAFDAALDAQRPEQIALQREHLAQLLARVAR